MKTFGGNVWGQDRVVRLIRGTKRVETEKDPKKYSMGLRGRWIPTSKDALMRSQTRLLDHFVKTTQRPYPKTVDVGNGRFMNAVFLDGSTPSDGTGTRRVLVLAHGLGSGLGFFFRNFDALSKRFDRIVAFDWMGFGGSSRPPCRYSPRLRRRGRGEADFFVEPALRFIESPETNLVGPGTKLTLCGHSLGGYLASALVAARPSVASTLLLLSPAGLAEPPRAVVPSSKLPTAMRLLDCAWSANVTPGQFVRWAGPRGPSLVEGVVRRRFRHLKWTEQETTLVSDYLYHITAAKGSGEYAMNSLLRPLVPQMDGRPWIYARKSLIEVLQGTGAALPPIRVLFGDQDWLYREGPCESAMEALRLTGHDVRMEPPLADAGHQLHLDNPAGTCKFIDINAAGGAGVRE